MQRITTINSIEVSSLCNNTCPYCPAPFQKKFREVGNMTMEIFEKAIEWVAHFCKQGTQRELNLFGIGEPTLNPDLAEMVRFARNRLPIRQIIHTNTNGKLMTEGLARKLRDAGITAIDITYHGDPRITARTIEIFRKLGIDGRLTVDPVTRPNNWAGQVDWFDSPVTYPCPWLHQGQVMVYSDGDVTTCCLDAAKKGMVGNIFDDITKFSLEPYELCHKCHQIVPENMQIIKTDLNVEYKVMRHTAGY